MLSLIPLLLTRCLRNQPARSAAALALQAPACSSSSWQCATLRDRHHAPQGHCFSSSTTPEPKSDEQTTTSQGTNSHPESQHVQPHTTTKPLLRNPLAPIHSSPPTSADQNQQQQPDLPELGMHRLETIKNLSPSLDEVTYQRHATSLNDGSAPTAAEPAYFPSKQDDGYGVQVGGLSNSRHLR